MELYRQRFNSTKWDALFKCVTFADAGRDDDDDDDDDESNANVGSRPP